MILPERQDSERSRFLRRPVVFLWIGALLLFGLDYGIQGSLDPQPHFRFWTYVAGPLFLLSGYVLRRGPTPSRWVATTVIVLSWMALWRMTDCGLDIPLHDCYASVAEAWLGMPFVLALYVGFPLAVTIAAVATLQPPTRSRPFHDPKATA